MVWHCALVEMLAGMYILANAEGAHEVSVPPTLLMMWATESALTEASEGIGKEILRDLFAQPIWAEALSLRPDIWEELKEEPVALFWSQAERFEREAMRYMAQL